MLHIFTIHTNDKWADIQLQHFEKYINCDYQVYVRMNENHEEYMNKYDVCVPGMSRHQSDSFKILYDIVKDSILPDDIVIRIDSDAFPIDNTFIDIITENLKKYQMIAIEEPEHELDLNIRIPHPSFMAFTAKSLFNGLDECLCSRSMKYENWWGDVMNWIESEDRKYYPLVRYNKVNLHPLYYGIYGGIIYHHWAGSRTMITRADRRIADRTGENLDVMKESNHKMSEIVFSSLDNKSDNFIKYLMNVGDNL